MPLSQEDIASIETVDHYTHDEDQAYIMLYGPRTALPWQCARRRHGGARTRGACA